MPIHPDSAAITFEAFLERPDRFQFELIDGRLAEVNTSALSANVAARVISELHVYASRSKTGFVFSSNLYYRCFPDRPNTGRKPDASFVGNDQLPTDWHDLGYFAFPPDLAVEVISTNDLAYEVSRKTVQYLKAGVRLVWNVDPDNRIIHVHRLGAPMTQLAETDRLDGEDVLPGFSCLVSDLFPPAAPVA